MKSNIELKLNKIEDMGAGDTVATFQCPTVQEFLHLPAELMINDKLFKKKDYWVEAK